MTFNVALSGLKAASSDLNVTGNNIANVGTTGFKASRTEFSDLYANSMLGSGKGAVGSGVVIADIAQQFNQGNISATGNSLDMAINGNGYFMLSNNGSALYTRAGAFHTDDEGYVINSSGYNLQGFRANDDGSIVDVVADLKIDTANLNPKATSSVTENLALNSNSDVPAKSPFNAKDSQSYNWSTSVPLYDAQGNAHTMTQYFVKSGSNEWSMHVLVDGRNPRDAESSTAERVAVSFDESGKLSTLEPVDPGAFTHNPDDNTLTLAWAAENGAATNDITLDLSSMTQTNTNFAVLSSPVQDGYTTGQLSGLSIDENGYMFASYTNGQSKTVGQVVLANFSNSQGLTPVGGTAWAQSLASGEPAIGTPGSGVLGSLAASSLEDSNVDLTAELINLIVAQRNYQANAKTIETESAISQTIINLR